MNTTKLDPDLLRGTQDQRVFIGGQYDFMPTLREIAQFVREISSPDKTFHPIIAYDYEILKESTIGKDLEILGRCGYALFDLSDLGAQLVEMQEAKQKRIESLIVYPVRDMRNEPERGRLTVLSFGLPHFGYRTFHELKGIVWRFLTDAPMDIDYYIPRIIYDPILDRETRRVRVLLANGEEDTAEERLTELVTTDPYENALELWLQRAFIGHYRGNDRLGKDALNKATEIAKGDPDAEAEIAYCRGGIELLANNVEDAKSLLEHAKSLLDRTSMLNPGVGRVLELLGYVNWRLKDRITAIENTKKALDDKSIPDPAVTIAALNNLAFFYAEEGRETGTIEFIYKADELSTYLPEYYRVFRSRKPEWLRTRGFVALQMANHLMDQPHRINEARNVLVHVRTVLSEANKRDRNNECGKVLWREMKESEKRLRTLVTTEKKDIL